MTRSLRPLACLVATLAATAAPAAIPEPGGLNAALRPSTLEEPSFVLSAEGDYVYTCRASGLTAGAYAWTFTSPHAVLREGSRAIGTMSVPNLWESASDRSSVSGVVRSVQATGPRDLPWLLLQAVPTSTTGLFAGVTSIQRVNTQGGTAPAADCGPGNEGSEARSAFRADYYFYRRRGSG